MASEMTWLEMSSLQYKLGLLAVRFFIVGWLATSTRRHCHKYLECYRLQVQVLSYKYKYIGLPLAMQMKLNKIHENWLS